MVSSQQELSMIVYPVAVTVTHCVAVLDEKITNCIFALHVDKSTKHV